MYKLSTIRIGSRPSKLALKQVEEVIEKLGVCDIRFEILTYNTSGDIDKNTPISEVEGTDFFTDMIEKALLNGEIDMAVHSAKDLPDFITDGLVIAKITKPIAKEDVLVSKNRLKLFELPKGARIGTSSQRRKQQLKNLRPDLECVNLRGNIEERIEKLKKDNLDGIIIARAALIRLGLEEIITEILPLDIFPTHPLQGALAIEVRRTDYELIKLLSQNENW
ncbi:MAG: hydroxymethylbilane synthase [Candidatus Omnitrophica bacterium]|nr:hydroxymethylbilane synthase [Candidatus Omnitrophota bacterium]MCM8802603.1 hydroxymethylbilane synthase [Candidatus Omnitrophota bacterium]